MTDTIEIHLKYARLIAEIARVFGPGPNRPGEDPVRQAGPRSGAGLGRVMGEKLLNTAKIKVAAKMAGNDQLAAQAGHRMSEILDDDWCPMYRKIIKPPKDPGWPGPDPDNPWPISWESFEILVSTVIDYHAAQPDGLLKDEVTEIVQKIAG